MARRWSSCGRVADAGVALVSADAGTIRVFPRESIPGRPHDHPLLASTRIAVRESDGHDVTTVELPGFPGGLLVTMSTDRTFHYYAGRDLAAVAGLEWFLHPCPRGTVLRLRREHGRTSPLLVSAFLMFKAVLKTVALLIIMFVMLYVGMNNTHAIDFRFPLAGGSAKEPIRASAALIFFGVFAVGLVAGTIITVGGRVGRKRGGARE